ncbi:hypothetical protein EDD18DRAFT_1112042 [Armillaria luteobubalina]|uniref:Uncharacterized protein n=1 Tax=Armillaria luteobubalina TaxID=153913 RepID=A0AA39PHC2_9AGAR|nr:hypothetical protein EDD18DRAFT_1112042 [Armillaria luteobubalina]
MADFQNSASIVVRFRILFDMVIFIETPPLSYARMQTRLAKKMWRADGPVSVVQSFLITRREGNIKGQDEGEGPEGSTSHSVVELQTQDGQNHKFDEADAYLKDDLRHRILVKFDAFLVNVLHLPDKWRDSLESDIAAVQEDEEYQTFFQAYLQLCDAVETGIQKERELYCPHAKLCNRVIDVLYGQPTSEVREEDLIGFFPIDPYAVRGSMAMVKPDMVGVLHILFTTPEGIEAHKFIKTIGDKSNTATADEPNPNGDKYTKSKSTRERANRIPGWPQVLEVKEMKGTDDTIDEGSDAIRLKTKDGKDPLTTRPKKNRTYLKDKANTVDVSCPESAMVDETAEAGPRGQKRKAEEGNEQSSSKVSRFSKTVSSRALGKVRSGPQKVLDEEGFAPGTDSAEKARIQCARYALHILSNAGLRSHALVTLIDRDRIQLSYYDRSAIIVSQAIDLTNGDDEIRFIAMLIGCHRLTLKQRGVLHDIIKDPYLTDFSRFNAVSKDPKLLFSGLEMELQKNNDNITLILGSIVYRQRGLFARVAAFFLPGSASPSSAELRWTRPSTRACASLQ